MVAKQDMGLISTLPSILYKISLFYDVRVATSNF